MTTSAAILTIAIPMASVVAAAFLRHIFDMKKERKYREMVGGLFWGILPFGVVSLIWTANGDAQVAASNWVLGIVGAAVGASAFIFGGYFVRDMLASAQNSEPSSKSASMPTPPPYAAQEQSLKDALANPNYSIQTKLLISHHKDLLQFVEEYRQELLRDPSIGPPNSKAAVAFFNKRLRETGKDWQITPENSGNIFLNTYVGASEVGIKIDGGGGNTFDQTDISGAQTGVMLQNTRNNHFYNTRIGPKGESTK